MPIQWPLIGYLYQDSVYKAKYDSYVNDIINNAFNENTMQLTYSNYANLIESYATTELPGYTFLNIQEHSKYISKNIENIEKSKIYKIGKKYEFLDNIFLKVLEENSEKMPNIFFNMFKASPNVVIKFLSNKSNILEDLSIILKMPKLTFIKALFK